MCVYIYVCIYKGIIEKKMRKAIAVDDYGKPEPNPKHDKKPGGSKR